MTSSTALGSSSRSAASRSHCSGYSANAIVPWVIAVRVVSLPPNTSTWKKFRNSVAVRRSPPTSACTKWLTTSSTGCSNRSSPSLAPYSYSPQAAGLPKGSRRSGVVLP